TDVQLGLAVAAHPSGAIALAGDFVKHIDFDNGSLTGFGKLTYHDYVARLDASGSHQWSTSFDLGSEQSSCCVAFTPSGKIVVAGYFENSADAGEIFLIELTP